MIRNRRVLVDAGTRVGKMAKSLVGPRPILPFLRHRGYEKKVD
jgi:hypothetical protein